ncbi:lytic transglycosylase domain-containing protein [Phenylobacterium soli]|uniref:lytic transglycosylase domain-containing protein n=1 Tax=Phenylobacterium soli TaxID=2170551 RepID=UPI001D04F417
MSALPWTDASPAARWRLIGAAAVLLSLGLLPDRATGGDLTSADVPQIIREAADRFGLPAGWIAAVMRRESGFDPRAVSPAGALGLMQLMPQTYAELRSRYALGDDPFLPRDNILAGAAYLREMYDRFGAPGFLAAYNAGPGRYAQHLAGRALPAETRSYVARLAPLIGGAATETRPPAASNFVDLTPASATPGTADEAAADSLFAPLTPRTTRP